MPRRTKLIDSHPLFHRVLCIYISGLLALPSLGALAGGQASVGASNAKYEVKPAGTSQKAPNPAPARLACRDTEHHSDLLPIRRNPVADKWGDITIAQPKIWEFERMNVLLDGLLRDLEGVSLADLTQLDASQQNAAALKFIQSALEVGVQYDQAAAVNASNALSSYNTIHNAQVQQLEQYNNYIQTLTNERDRLAVQYAASTNEVNSLQALKVAGPLTDAQNKQLEEALSRQSSTQASLTAVNSLISGAGPSPTLTPAPTVAGTSVQGPASGSTMSSSLSGFSDVLKSLPQGMQNNLNAALQSPSYPATKRLDNFVTLLYERLAREISVLQDDLTRDPDNVAFMLQFDVGLYPSKKAKDRVARVEFDLDCPGCKVYSLYPGQSAYNLANFSGSSKRNSFWGNALTLIGLGMSASYRRQTDTLQGSLVQSVYTVGFQNGVMYDDTPRASKHEQVNANQAEQSFGWYYGAAPFEQFVSPGIRSTFALITVPRTLVERTQDRFGNANACLPFHIDAAWANRNDPLAQVGHVSAVGEAAKGLALPFYYPTRNNLYNSEAGNEAPPQVIGPDKNRPYDASVLTMMTSVKLPASLGDYSLVARREKQKLHVLRLAYNTVEEKTDAAASTTVQTTIQTNSQSSNPVTGQTTSQTTTQSTGTTVAVANATDTKGASSSSSPPSPLLCPQGKCASVLIKLDRVIDPNLVITVNGQPLMRVRDWRGRATSVLPPAQSGTDVPGASATGSLTSKQLQQTRGLLETDQFAPNTWFALNSQELLLNISVDVASDTEFPLIQLADPSGSVVIPHDLRRNITELVVDNFHLKPKTERAIRMEVARQQSRDENEKKDKRKKESEDGESNDYGNDAPISSGPYAFSTYLPLFSPMSTSRSFYATVGETGDDLLIGFLPNPTAEKTREETLDHGWLAAQTRIILEDRDQDFAWSLSCGVQGNLLACHIPRDEISRVYFNSLRECPSSKDCPGLYRDQKPLLQSLEATVAQLKSDRGSTEEQAKDELWKDNDNLEKFKNAFVSTMQLWVQQSDLEHKNIFYSPEPVRIGFLPLSNDYWNDSHFKSWEFKSADSDGVTLSECNYLPSEAQSGIYVSLLGVRSWRDWIKPRDSKSSAATPDSTSGRDQKRDYWVALTDAGGCGEFTIPTAALMNNPIVFQMEFPPHDFLLPPAGEDPPASPDVASSTTAVKVVPSKRDLPIRTTVALPRFGIAPSFKISDIQIRETGRRSDESSAWEVSIPVSHATCADQIKFSREPLPSTVDAKAPDSTKISVEWGSGLDPIRDAEGSDRNDGPCNFEKWQKGDEAGRIKLFLKIPRAAISNIPNQMEVVRTTSDGVEWVVATLPNLRRLLLPSRLTLEPLGATQFVLRGERAEVIDAVALQSGSDRSAVTYPTTPGLDFALVTLPALASSSGSESSGVAAGATGGSRCSTQATIDTTKDKAGHVKMTTQNKSSPAKASAQDAKAATSLEDKTAGAKPLAPGSYAVLPLVLIGDTSLDVSKTIAKERQDTGAKTAFEAAKTAADPGKGKKADLPEAKAAKQKQAAADKAKKAQDKEKKEVEPTPIYMPLTVSDEKGKPLTFTVAEPKKQTAQQGNSTPASTASGCVATPPSPSPAGTPKAQ